MREKQIKAPRTQIHELQWQKLALLAVIIFVVMLIGRLERTNDSNQGKTSSESNIEKMVQSAGM
jgi:hypothetical protein